MVIGLDLDNTIICYDGVFERAVRRLGIPLPSGTGAAPGKQEIRDAVWAMPSGDVLWTQVQALAYGPLIAEAVAFPGVEDFLERARSASHELFVISHKTRCAAADPDGADLREAARRWWRDSGLAAWIGEDRLAFTGTRAEKAAAIARLAPRWFVDDLPEMFAEPGFPATTAGLLFAPGGAGWGVVPARVSAVCRTWDEVGREVFG